ncbi:hypothetical protein HOB87_04405 [Candidatus Woesearchaeota archaeon]|jgi:hypothetical protein|nr:hypothetical protein [Candidatus Woesearchaeota archaeon]
MSKNISWVDNNHYRSTSDDGKTSYLYKAGNLSDTCIEIAEHHDDGTTDAYKPGVIFDKGEHK